MSYWWISQTGRNTLKGVEGDPSNPIALPDHLIIRFLATIPKARFDFVKIFPTLLPEEQDRLRSLIEQRPFLKTKILQNEQDNTDEFQKRLNEGPIRTSGRLGGKRIG